MCMHKDLLFHVVFQIFKYVHIKNVTYGNLSVGTVIKCTLGRFYSLNGRALGHFLRRLAHGEDQRRLFCLSPTFILTGFTGLLCN
jgi:hypothetical protein